MSILEYRDCTTSKCIACSKKETSRFEQKTTGHEPQLYDRRERDYLYLYCAMDILGVVEADHRRLKHRYNQSRVPLVVYQVSKAIRVHDLPC